MQYLKLKRIGPRLFMLEQEYKSECGITVPYGFVSDGISVPFGLRWIVAPTGVGFNASLVHDYLLSQEYSWQDAAERFEEQLVLDGVSYIRRKAYLFGVKSWGIIRGKR